MDDVISSTGFFARTFPVKDSDPKTKKGHFSIASDSYPSLLDVSNDFAEDFYRAGVMSGYDVYTRDVDPVSPEDATTLRDILDEEVDDRYYNVDVEKWEYMKGSKRELRTRADGSTYYYTEGSIPFPDILDRPGRTMLTSEGTPNRSSHIIEDPHTGKLRILTPTECERLNGFPPGWTDTGMSERQRYFTMGNALVVQLITMMGKTLIDIDSNAS